MSAHMDEQLDKDSARKPMLDRKTAMRLAAGEYDRFAAAVGDLDGDDWQRPTDCTAWDVRQVACHVIGMAEMAAGIRESSRQQKIAGEEAAREGVELIDALTGLQVRERADWTPEQVVAAARSVGRRATRGRRFAPFFVRRRLLPEPEIVNGRPELWTLGYLLDVILTRDTWMHRMDVARATGRPPLLSAEHDGVLVADVVDEWAERHGQPYRLALAGPAGGTWSRGSGGPSFELDAVEFCRLLSGRGHGDGLLSVQVPF